MHIPPDWGIFSALIVSFLIFWFIFGRLFFAPFLKLLGDREHRLRELGERTEQLLRDEKAAIEAREAALAVVRHEALSRRETERRQAEAEAVRLISEARAEAKAELDQLRAGIRPARTTGRNLGSRTGGTRVGPGGCQWTSGASR